MIFRRATENNALIPAIVGAVNMFPEFLCFPVKGEGARGKRLVVPKGTADILGLRAVLVAIGQAITRASLLPGEFGAPNPMATQLRVGQAFAIETKWTHRPTCKCASCKAQRGWRGEWEKRGGLYVLARSPQEAIDGLMGRRAA
jgi:hypothetical protein